MHAEYAIESPVCQGLDFDNSGAESCAVAAAEQVYQYLVPSSVLSTGNQTDLLLATSGGNVEDEPAEHPRFFDGFLVQPEQTAVAMLGCARVARTRYYMPPAMVAAIIHAADPVVTSEKAELRFESFSVCGGVYARLDVLAEGLDRKPSAVGTTNVDFNPPMREALARIAASQPVRLHVGADDVGIKTFGGQVVEQKVPLPERWVRGFAEVQVAAAGLEALADLSIADARPFLRSLPRASRHLSWAHPASKSLRLSSLPGSGAVCVAGPERLRSVEPLLRFAKRLRVYGRDAGAHEGPAASAWELVLDDARFTVVLSPEVSRGFSGEGGLLFDLASSEAELDATTLMPLLGWGEPIDIDRLAKSAGLSRERTRTALMFLAAQGRVGYDLAQSAYFHRELPLRADALMKMNPRLQDARQLVSEGKVRLEPGGAQVESGDVTHHVTFSAGGDRCTCPWWGKYAGTRGPCKHVLAARLAARG
jgi:SWIM zinc finger